MIAFEGPLSEFSLLGSFVIELEPYACVKHSGELCYRVRTICM